MRPGELRKAEWADIDLDAAEWRYTVTKTNTAHIVPLAIQAVAILKELQPLTERSPFVFPGARSSTRPMSDNAILGAMRRLGIAKDEMSGHGFRAMARTILDEVLGVRPDYIEHPLAHSVKDPNGRAYNLRRHSAMESASHTSFAVMRSDIAQPTTRREYRSSTTARYSQWNVTREARPRAPRPPALARHG